MSEILTSAPSPFDRDNFVFRDFLSFELPDASILPPDGNSKEGFLGFSSSILTELLSVDVLLPGFIEK